MRQEVRGRRERMVRGGEGRRNDEVRKVLKQTVRATVLMKVESLSPPKIVPLWFPALMREVDEVM